MAALVEHPVPRSLVGLVGLAGQVGPIDQLLVPVVTTIELHRHRSHTLSVQEVGYFVGPMETIPAEVVPMHQEKKARPIVSVPRYLLGSTCSKQAVVEPGFVRPTLRPVAVEPGFAHPMGRLVAEHPMYWVVDQAGSKNLHQVYFPVGSILEVELVVPDVANPKMP